MLVMIVVAFTFCWLPYETYLVLNEVWPQILLHQRDLFLCSLVGDEQLMSQSDHLRRLQRAFVVPRAENNNIKISLVKKFQREYLRAFYKCFCRDRLLKREWKHESELDLRRSSWGRASRCHFYIFNELGKAVE
ncbi:putative adipocyte plasma membrane-associated protein [Trichinella spiralis]|uniref:putative adipocyte plasma membrane-associated protein n=1 Tax=Trichinella spiralis TaxID=6334 RepID=UPI0001EFC38C|nr:putative adipocyte plasma membrane-associated protein [Trichinella spiralis]